MSRATALRLSLTATALGFLLLPLASAEARARSTHSAHHARRQHRAKIFKLRSVHLVKPARSPVDRRIGAVATTYAPANGTRLSLDRRWGSNSFGSVGYQRLGASPLGAHDVNAAAGTQFGAPAAVVGAGVSHRF